MPTIRLSTKISAPIEVVFDLARSVDLHVESTSRTKERAVAGRTSGLLEQDETVIWEAVHFGIRQRLTVQITEFTRPVHFRDSMLAGIFSRFDHDHHFQSVDTCTEMIDVIEFASPLGPFGHLANRLLVTRHLRKLLQRRNQVIKSVAESDRASEFLANH